ncbi:MAG: 23S rRNA (guanosine(2251)-2'-O)-methyltransferase RlmB [Flavobacteriales bacterium]
MKEELVAGIRPVTEALAANRNIEKLLVRRDSGHAALREIKQLALEREIPWQPVPLEKLDRMTTTEHQGVIALLSPVEEQNLDEVIARAYERGETPLIVALDGVTDVRNVGAVSRSAECFGAHAVLVPKQGSARLGSDAVKSSAGALLRVPVCRAMDFSGALKRAQEHGLRIVACTEKGSGEVGEADLRGPLVLVMGAEDTGVSPQVLRLAEDLVRIPMIGSIGSLNVSVATGIALYAALKQRAAKG